MTRKSTKAWPLSFSLKARRDYLLHRLLHALIFSLAFLSFACLFGEFYGLWTMRWFGCWILPPATIVLACIAWAAPIGPPSLLSPRLLIVEGAAGGVVAAVAYDLYRLPFVLGGVPLFKVFPIFGQLLLGADEPEWLVQFLGWTYHFSNGAALGIMFLALIGPYLLCLCGPAASRPGFALSLA